jgi:pimeloyl-ACP methyl ester carboxylesterase
MNERPKAATSFAVAAAAASQTSTSGSITYHWTEVDGICVFYREAGAVDAPTIVLLHGYPSSSRMFDSLIPLLAGRYHLIAPDYPGFGHSDFPPPTHYAYTFDHLAGTVRGLLEQLGVARCTFYLQDYGGPVGFRIMLAQPEKVRALVIQNANAYREGLGKKWEGIARYWDDPETYSDQVDAFTSLESARQRHLAGSPRPERYNPDTWTDEFAALQRPGVKAIQASLLYDYRTNVAAYPQWQAWLRENQPATLVLWGRYDPSFVEVGARAYLRDLPRAEMRLLDAGHFALDERVDEIAAEILAFLEGVPA